MTSVVLKVNDPLHIPYHEERKPELSRFLSNIV
jgi:hypothetical protein